MMAKVSGSEKKAGGDKFVFLSNAERMGQG